MQEILKTLAVAGVLALGMPHGTARAHESQAGVVTHYFAAPDSPEFRKFAPDRLVDVLEVALDVTPDFKEKSVAGSAIIRFKPVGSPLRELPLDAVSLRITEVSSSHPLKEWQNTDQQLVLTFKEPVPVGEEASATIHYSASPKKGLYFRTADMGYKAEDTHLFTQGETTEARHWYPSVDFPNEKFATQITCRIPPDMTVISNGRLLSNDLDGQSGMRVVTWRQDKPHVNYLVSLVAGYFKSIEDAYKGMPVAFYTPASQIGLAENSFQDTLDMMAFFEQEIGFPYPWDKYHQVCVQGFMWGGMENTSVTTLTDRTLFPAEVENLRSSQGLVAHELAHQWFGDLVTCKDWSQIWLNEGFATYYSALYELHKSGRDEFLHDMLGNLNAFINVPVGEGTRPVVWREYNQDIDMFRPSYHVYSKSAWILHMLKNQIGEANFRRGVRLYLERHQFGSVVTHDLIKVMEEVSGKSLDRFFDQWLFRGHHPELEVSYSWDGQAMLAKITARQKQAVSKEVALFDLPLTIRFKGDFGVRDVRVQLSEKSQDYYFPLPSRPLGVRIDPEFVLLAKIDFNPGRDALMRQIRDESDMLGRLKAVQELGKAKDKESREALAERLNTDPFHAVRIQAAQELGKWGADEALEILFGGRSQPDARVRQAVASAIAQSAKPAALPMIKELLGAEKNPLIRATLISALGGWDVGEVADLVESALVENSFDNAVAAAAVEAIRKTGDQRFAGLLLSQLQAREEAFAQNGMGRAMNVLARLAKGSPHAGPTLQFLMARVDSTRRGVARGAVEALGALGNPLATGLLEKLAQGGDEDLAGPARNALNELDGTRPIPVDVRNLRETLSEVRKEQDELRKSFDDLKKKFDATATRPPEEAKAK